MITLTVLALLAIVLFVLYILIEFAWPLVLLIIACVSIDVLVFKLIFKGGKKK